MVLSQRIRIENIVASATLNVSIPLGKLVRISDGVEYEPEQFPGVVYRMKEPKAASLIFSSGKIVCTGTRNTKDLKKAFQKIRRLIAKTGIRIQRNFKVRIENIVASTKLDARLNLDKIAFTLENSEYEPEQFPGLVLRMKNPNVAFLLFSSGKIVCTGARKRKDVTIAIEKLVRKLKSIGAIVKE